MQRRYPAQRKQCDRLNAQPYVCAGCGHLLLAIPGNQKPSRLFLKRPRKKLLATGQFAVIFSIRQFLIYRSSPARTAFGPGW